MNSVERSCGRPTKKGTPCTRPLHSWITEGFGFERADGCWRHMSQPYKAAAETRKREDEEAWLAYLYADPICWQWPTRSDFESWTDPREEDERLTARVRQILASPEIRATAFLNHWQNGRCAICGHRRELVEDHDHVTGLVRGYLCRGCNTQEGIYGEPDTLFGKYRDRHPTKMLGLQVRYWDPIRGEYVQPTCPEAEADKWTDAASEDIGL